MAPFGRPGAGQQIVQHDPIQCKAPEPHGIRQNDGRLHVKRTVEIRDLAENNKYHEIQMIVLVSEKTQYQVLDT